MKAFLASIALAWLLTTVQSQNLLSPLWRYHDIEGLADLQKPMEKDWTEINLLLSWERQGYTGLDGMCVITNDFYVDERFNDLELAFSFPAEVNSVFINKKKICGKVPNSFWDERGKKTVVSIPKAILNEASKNEISIVFDNLSYTGGLSYNTCTIQPLETELANSLTLKFPTENHVYLEREQREFSIHSENSSDNEVNLLLYNDFHEKLIDETLHMKKGKQEYVFDFSEKKLGPGIYECVLIGKGKGYCGEVAWFAIEPEKIVCSVEKKSGFDAYWQKARDELANIAPNFKLTKEDRLCSSTRDGYIVEMTSLDNLTIRGYYFVPKASGKHPVVLHLPGYSYGFEDIEGFIQGDGQVADLALCVRGHGISKDVFDPWDVMTLWAVGICDREKYVYRAMYMDCVRAVEFLLSRPEIDKTKIGVEGGSQGGGLAIATAGLCSDTIAALAIFDPWMCDFGHQAAIRTVIHKELESFTHLTGVACSQEQMFTVLDSIDTKYFASDIQCPVYFATALFDDDCPSHCGFSVYNAIKNKMGYKVYPYDSHLGESGQYSELSKVLRDFFLE